MAAFAAFAVAVEELVLQAASWVVPVVVVVLVHGILVGSGRGGGVVLVVLQVVVSVSVIIIVSPEWSARLIAFSG